MGCKVVNLEAGMPSVQTAHVLLNQALISARANRIKAIKFIHGYGSSGRGGAIKQDVHRTLLEKKRAGIIKEFVKGEDFDPFHSTARKVLELCPELNRDSDYNRGNDGITIVVF